MTTYTCPGLHKRQPKGTRWPGYIACYLAGHECPPKVATVTEYETTITTAYRCPCCGEMGVFSVERKERHG